MGFLTVLASALTRRGTPYVMAAPRRASVAVVIRVTGYPPEAYAPPSPAAGFLASPAAQAAPAERCELLYIKRASNPNDAWSGNVAFPGGRRQAEDADDRATAVRETLEEVGLDLSDATRFEFLGRLDDRPVYARGRRKEGFALCPFVYVQSAPATPPLALQRSEVAAARWVPLSQLTHPGADFDPFGVKLPFGYVPALSALPAWLKRLLGVEHAFFPAVLLRPAAVAPAAAAPRGAGAAADGASLEEAQAAAAIAEELSTAAPPPAFDSHDDPSQQFQLWGLTLAITSDVLALTGHARLTWPYFRLSGVLSTGWVYAACGAIELWELAHRRRRPAHVRPLHVAWTLGLAAAPFLLATGAGWAAQRLRGGAGAGGPSGATAAAVRS